MANFGRFQAEGYKRTRAEVKAIESEIIDIYREAQREIEDQLRKTYSKLPSINPADGGYYKYITQHNRLTKLQASIANSFKAHQRAVRNQIFTASEVSITNSYYRSLYASTWANSDIKFGPIPEGLIELSVSGTEEAFQDYTVSLAKRFGSADKYTPINGTLAETIARNNSDDLARIRRAIVQSMTLGEPYTKAVDRIKDITGREAVKNGTLTVRGAKSRALRIVRTESNRNANAGTYAQQKFVSNQGINLKRRLLATLDDRTREQSASMDGQTVGIDEPFTYPNGTKAFYPGTTGNPSYDINDRETVISIITDPDGKDVEPTKRRGRNPLTGKNEAFNYKSFNEWAEENNLVRNKSGRLQIKKD